MANWAEQTKHRGGAAVDTISELTSGAGVTADGVLLKDSQVTTDVINEKTVGAGVTADGVQMKDGNLETVAVEQLTQQGSTPATPAAGKTKLYVKTDGVAYILNPDGIETPIGSGSTVERVTQATHGFDEGEALYYTGTEYAKARADDSATAEVVCMVSRVIDANTFEFVTNGIVEKTAWGLTAGEVYFLSDTTAGAITTTEPTTVSYISKPLLVATSTTSGVFVNMRGTTVGGTNLYTTIPLNNGTATTIQNLSASTFPNNTGGYIEGFMKILQSSGTNYGFDFKVHFYKVDGSTIKITPEFNAGDVPPGFAITDSGANINVSFTPLANFSSGSATFCMQAAAIGTKLPLQIDGSNVTGSTLGSTTGAAVEAGRIGEVISASVTSGSAVTCTNNTYVDITSIELTPGIWMITAHPMLQGTPTGTNFLGGIGDVSGNSSTGLVRSITAATTPMMPTSAAAVSLFAMTRIEVTSTVTKYLKAYTLFSSGSCSAFGTIMAVRIA